VTTIADLSRYDGRRPDISGYDGIIVNCQDPDLGGKVEDALAQGKPWGSYGWVYPDDGAGSMQRLVDNVSGIGHGVPPLGYELDYEQNGVTQVDLVNALDRSETCGTFGRTMVYTYLYIIGSVANILRGRPLWLAYYPGNNDGAFPAGEDGPAKAWGALLWQYTSSNGTRDLSHVVDEPAWATWSGVQTPAPLAPTKDDSMWIVEKRDGQPDQWWEPTAGGLVQLSGGEAYARLAAGIAHIEMPTMGVIGYSLRCKATLQAGLKS